MSLLLDDHHRQQDEITVRRILLLREEKEKVVQSGGGILSDVFPVRFYDYGVSVIANKKPKNRAGYMNALSSFSHVYPDVMVAEITPRHASRYASFISGLSPCTINHYYVALRHVCSKAVSDGILEKNPFAGLSVKRVPAEKEFLTIPELEKMIATECANSNVKRAFLFSCFTGLRLGDVGGLVSDQIRDGYLYFTQAKTGAHERLRLPSVALEIVSGVEGLLFPLPGYKQLRRDLFAWVKDAGISKRITFHCSRHTFATLQLTMGTDIYTVSKLLGHSDVRVTQVYAKLVDAKKDDAMLSIDTAFSR
jgi:integrase